MCVCVCVCVLLAFLICVNSITHFTFSGMDKNAETENQSPALLSMTSSVDQSSTKDKSSMLVGRQEDMFQRMSKMHNKSRLFETRFSQILNPPVRIYILNCLFFCLTYSL